MQHKIVWKTVITFAFIHFYALIFLINFHWKHFLFHFIFETIASFGILAGAHRLWSHRSYEANKPLQILLMILQTVAGQKSVISWARDHRCHHKFSDTDADPSNSQRGLFFSHIGWLLVMKHKDVIEYGRKIDVSDLESNPILIFQQRFFIPIFIIFSIMTPMVVSMYLITPYLSPFMAFCAICFRYMQSLHRTWLVNSIAHTEHFGSLKPYDKNIAASDSKFVAILTNGEGWHNFHHTFPWDHRASECQLYRYNLTLAFINFFEKIGWATKLKKVSDKEIKERVLKTGDDSHPYIKNCKEY